MNKFTKRHSTALAFLTSGALIIALGAATRWRLGVLYLIAAFVLLYLTAHIFAGKSLRSNSEDADRNTKWTGFPPGASYGDMLGLGYSGNDTERPSKRNKQ